MVCTATPWRTHGDEMGPDENTRGVWECEVGQGGNLPVPPDDLVVIGNEATAVAHTVKG